MKSHRKPAFVITDHAKQRAPERGVHNSMFWAAKRQAIRCGLRAQLEIQHQKLAPMLTETDVHARIGKDQYTAAIHGISTKLDVDGVTFVVGIKREGDSYSPLTVKTVWH
jgi:hypothetical protein